MPRGTLSISEHESVRRFQGGADLSFIAKRRLANLFCFVFFSGYIFVGKLQVLWHNGIWRHCDRKPSLQDMQQLTLLDRWRERFNLVHREAFSSQEGIGEMGFLLFL